MLQAGGVDEVNKLFRFGRSVRPMYPGQTDVQVENYVAPLRVLVKTWWKVLRLPGWSNTATAQIGGLSLLGVWTSQHITMSMTCSGRKQRRYHLQTDEDCLHMGPVQVNLTAIQASCDVVKQSGEGTRSRDGTL